LLVQVQQVPPNISNKIETFILMKLKCGRFYHFLVVIVPCFSFFKFFKHNKSKQRDITKGLGVKKQSSLKIEGLWFRVLRGSSSWFDSNIVCLHRNLRIGFFQFSNFENLNIMEQTQPIINFATETEESLLNKGIVQIDFVRAFAGTPVVATEIEENLYELDGAEVRYALLTNGDTVYSDDLSDLRQAKPTELELNRQALLDLDYQTEDMDRAIADLKANGYIVSFSVRDWADGECARFAGYTRREHDEADWVVSPWNLISEALSKSMSKTPNLNSVIEKH
jgi:hypothetical protein